MDEAATDLGISRSWHEFQKAYFGAREIERLVDKRSTTATCEMQQILPLQVKNAVEAVLENQEAS
jgi:hypothetical protein